MKILLVNPYCIDERLQDYDIRVVPIGLHYLGAYLIERGHDCRIVNWYNAESRPHEISDTFLRFRPDVAAFSILHANRWGGIEIARTAKELLPDITTVFGGPGATFLWRHLMTHFNQIDYIVLGEGEETLSELVDLIGENGKDGPDNIRGLVFRDGNGQVCKTAVRDFIQDIDKLPNPARFFTYQHVISSRGCPFSCTFCGSPAFWKRKVRFHSPSYFVDQLELLAKKGVRHFYVSDDTFTVKPQRVVAICKEILERGLDITWVAISRVNCITSEILYWMRRAGCQQISFGIESGDRRIRKLYKKQISDTEAREAFRLCRSYGILPRAYFIYGAPGENRKSIRASIRLMEKIRPLGAIFYILDLFPGTALYDNFRKNSGITDEIWLRRIEDIMYFETDPSLSREDILKYGRMLRSAWYSSLPEYAAAVGDELVDLPELYPHHADFLSRLGMTFAFGAFAAIPDIPRKEQTAELLFMKALEFHPDSRAFLGAGAIKQKNRDFQDSVDILMEGSRHFPRDAQIHACLGISLMNLGRLEEALDLLLGFPEDRQCLQHAAHCARELGRLDLAQEIMKRMEHHER